MHVSGKIRDIIRHFHQEHPENRQGNVDTELNLLNICENEELVLHLTKLDPFYFVVYLKIDPLQRKIYIAAHKLGAGASKWIYEIQVYNKREPRRKLTCSDICHSYTTPIEEIFRETKCITIPMSYAMTYFSEGTWTYKYFLRKYPETEQKSGRRRGRGSYYVRKGYGRGRGGSN